MNEFQDQLKQRSVQQGMSVKKPAGNKNKKGISEKLSSHDLRDLMGTDRDIYSRRGGAIRKK